MNLGLDDYANLAIMATAFRVSKKLTIPVDVIVTVSQEGDDYIMTPLLIVVSDALASCIIPPEGNGADHPNRDT